MTTSAPLPESIRSLDDLRVVLQRLETLTSILRPTLHPAAALPPREEMARGIELLTEYARRTLDPVFTASFHQTRTRRR